VDPSDIQALPDRNHRDDFISRLGDGIARVFLGIAAIALLCIVAINAANVIGRYFFNAPFSWAEELMLFLMVVVVFTGVIAVGWRNQHIRIDAFIDRAPPTFQRIVRLMTSLVTIIVLVAVAAAGSRVVTTLYAFDQRSDALHFPIWIPQAFVVIGLGLMAVLAAVSLARSRFRWTSRRAGLPDGK